ncbi:bifunctional RNase H/acid phosphatase [Embleya hyalina]|uniref:Putative phosphoglycerate mutase n=1 Tax=Embleya hyalina TaxID=516124 RepID=A0A401YZA6_9ACTN|nr:bifunctional RNase H/acid phosphatase [Embleya hyalina]GCD99923.1 putative phosphoglycerate mutase [Embleya hyalina]
MRLVVEADGGSRGNPGPAAYGALVRDADTGEVLHEIAEAIGVATNNVAEYRGLIAGLTAAHTIDPTATVEVRADSKLVVEQMSGRWKIKHADMRDLATKARGIHPPGQVTYTWIPRERNKHADRLANEAMDAAAKGRAWTAQNSTAFATAGPAEAAPAAEPVPSGPAASAKARPTAPGWGPDLGRPTTLVLLRHGETALTPQKRFSGTGADPELSERGRWQAARAAEALAERGTIEAIVSSPLGRCRQTAEAVAQRLGLKVREEPGFRETDFGAWEGLTFAEARERTPDALDAWLTSADAAPPGGESFTEVARRVEVARDKTIARYAGRTVLVVTHVTPIKTLVRIALGAPAESMFRMELSAAAISAVQWWSDGNASLRVFNETAHLR